MNKKQREPYSHNQALTVINFFGGPGCGKSVTAAYLFGDMKCAGMKVELIHEVAKDYVWEDWAHIFGEQDYIFAHQNRMLRRLIGHDIEYAVVDSSILLSLFYMPDDFPQSFRAFAREAFDSYNNINIFLDRNPDLPYIQTGRNESELQAIELDRRIREYFYQTNTPCHHVLAGSTAAAECMKIIANHPT
jgi:AAA domain